MPWATNFSQMNLQNWVQKFWSGCLSKGVSLTFTKNRKCNEAEKLICCVSTAVVWTCPPLTCEYCISNHKMSSQSWKRCEGQCYSRSGNQICFLKRGSQFRPQSHSWVGKVLAKSQAHAQNGCLKSQTRGGTHGMPELALGSREGLWSSLANKPKLGEFQASGLLAFRPPLRVLGLQVCSVRSG